MPAIAVLRAWLTACALMLSIAAIGDARASDLRISTIRIDLSDQRPVAAITLQNAGSARMLVQLKVVAWGEANGGDTMSPTDAVIANPPLAQIEAGATQLARIGYLGKLQGASEKTFRLLIEEVPLVDEQKTPGVHTYLNLRVPVFVAPLAAAAQPLSATWSPANPAALIVANPGNTHVRITRYTLIDGASSGHENGGLFYILAGGWMPFPIDGTRAPPAKIRLTTDSGVVEIPVEAVK